MGHDDPNHPHHHPHAHDEHHAHAHEHAHEHEHAHDEDTLERGAGAGKILFFDAPSGIAGDMTIAALVDLGVPRTHVAETIAQLPITGFHLHFGSKVRSGIVATHFDVHLDEAQPHRDYAAIKKLLDEAKLADGIKARAHATFRRLAESEARVHKMPIDHVHFHEVGAVDAIVDVVGSAAALEWIGADTIVVSPLPLGRGYTKAAHGVLPLPPPATVACLEGLATYDGGLDFEFVTPTGAAIMGAHARASSRWPSMSPERIGWGAGTKDLADRPNVLRAVLGRPVLEAGARATHVVVEANVDDATGELAASAIESLFAAGALDAWATPITMKKGRPALTLSALAPLALADAVASAMLRETTSLGVRRYEVTRDERPRRIVEVETPYGTIPVKIAEGPYGPPQVKPEFDACAAAARAHGVPVREVIRAALTACR